MFGKKMKYPALAIGSRGFAQLIKSEHFWESFPVSFIGIYTKRASPVDIFSSDGTMVSLISINPLDKLTFFERFLGGSRSIRVEPTFGEASEVSLEEFKDRLASAVREDDDILCQHEDEGTILAKLSPCKSFAQVIQLVRWATKDFSKYKE